MKTKIYCLYDPIECMVRYIGRTNRSLEKRLMEHILEARHYALSRPGGRNPYKSNWINKLLSEGRIPQIKLLTLLETWEDSHKLESQLIGKHLEKRRLVNAKDLGEGLKTRLVSEKTRALISSKAKERYKHRLNPKAKCIEVYDLEGNFIETYPSATTFAKLIKVAPRRVTRVAANEYGRLSVKGFQVKYCDDPKLISKYSPTGNIPNSKKTNS